MKKINDSSQLKGIASQVRRDIIKMVYNAQSGHPGGSLGATEYFVSLFFQIMDYQLPFDQENLGVDEDTFFLSNGHISPVYYSTLARVGYFEVSELSTFRQLNTRLQGHPATQENLPGIRIASGSLGQGLSCAIGMALSKKLNKDNHLVYVLMGDGEQQEGQIWEAAMFAAHNKVDNLIATIDYNKQQIDGSTDDVLSLGDLHSKYTAFGWDVTECNGNNMDELIATFQKTKNKVFQKKPLLILMHTQMGKGVDFMEGTHEWHGKAPSQEQYESALMQLNETLGDF